ncbi:putative ribosome biogenesis protein C8F11.04 [Diplonema papillatum]|nr:putative ribosome biogenesis protein C8F11.04 [Diplonema papillatum]
MPARRAKRSVDQKKAAKVKTAAATADAAKVTKKGTKKVAAAAKAVVPPAAVPPVSSVGGEVKVQVPLPARAASASGRMPRTEEAAAKLLTFMEAAEKKQGNTLIAEASPIFLSVSLMQSLPKTKSMKRVSVPIPHSIFARDNQECCLITTSPQRQWKDIVCPRPEFKNIKKIIDINKLRKKFKAFESKRQLATQFNYFLADEAVVNFLPKLLGDTFFRRNKEPVLVNMKKFPKSLTAALDSTSFSIQDNVNLSILIGNTDFSAAELAANAHAVMDGVVKECPNGWREILYAVVKGSETPGLHVYAHDYPESVVEPLVPSTFPKKHRLLIPELEKPSKKRKKAEEADAAEELADAKAIDGDAGEEDVELSDLEAISDMDDDESA